MAFNKIKLNAIKTYEIIYFFIKHNTIKFKKYGYKIILNYNLY